MKFDIEPYPETNGGQFHVYVFLRSEKRLVYGGMYLDKQAAMNSVRRSVGALGLRCLFYWDVVGNYRCGGDDRHIYGRITLERTELVESIEYLPFDSLETP
jgi:hypothetical protein